MMHAVTIYDGKGNLKKTISAEDVKKNFWKHVTNGHIVQPRNGWSEYICDWCQESFHPIIRNQKFCCPEHQKENIEHNRRASNKANKGR